MMVVVMAVVVSVVVGGRQVFDASCNNSEALLKGRFLTDHLALNLSQIASIESVSNSGDAQGYIQFKDYHDATYRYQLNDSGNNWIR